jgi:5,10-methylenetetrahydromethanopterin reductase
MACEAGIQFHLASTAGIYTTRDLLRLTDMADDAGLTQVWLTDNLGVPNIFAVLSALATCARVKLGTAIIVQYFRNPVDVAGALATISELMGGRELGIGLGRGSLLRTPGYVQPTRAVATLRETAMILKALLAGDRVRFRDYPVLTSYFNMATDGEATLAIKPSGPVPVYGGGNGPRSLAVAGGTMDGVMYGGSFVAAVLADKVKGLLSIADSAASKASRQKKLRKVAEVNISISSNREAARGYAKKFAASVLIHLRKVGYSTEDFHRMRVDPERVDRLVHGYHEGVPQTVIADMVTDEMIDATTIAGDGESCRERILTIFKVAAEHGFEQVMFSKLGPDYSEAISLLAGILR